MAFFLSLALVLSAAAAADANAKLAPAQALWLNAALPIPQRVSPPSRVPPLLSATLAQPTALCNRPPADVSSFFPHAILCPLTLPTPSLNPPRCSTARPPAQSCT